MLTKIQSILYIDPGAQKHAAFCPDCGREVYAPSLTCLRCERKRP